MKKKGIKLFSDLFVDTRQKFTNFAQSYVRSRDVAEDIVMDSFMYYWENIDNIDYEQNIEAYLLKVIKHKCLNYLKRLQKQKEIGHYLSKMEAWELGVQISSLEACNPDKLFSKEIQEIISKSIETLPSQTREIFIHSRYNNQTNKEIAKLLYISTKSVEYHITKSLKLLRTGLKDYLLILFILINNH